MKVSEVLELRSSEADLICERGHIYQHPHTCADECILVQSEGTVRDVLAHKDPTRAALLPNLQELPALQVEAGWLIDGHHRVLAALQRGEDELETTEVSGILTNQRAYHASLRTKIPAQRQG